MMNMKTWQKLALLSIIIFELLDLGTTVYALQSSQYIFENNPLFAFVNTKTLINYISFAVYKLLAIFAISISAYFAIRGYNKLEESNRRPILKKIGKTVGILGLGFMVVATYTVVIWNIIVLSLF